jgi:SLAP domain-containing protein
MKKFLLAVALFSTVLAGCSSEDQPDTAKAKQPDLKVQEKLDNKDAAGKEVKAQLVLLDNQPALKEAKAMELLNSAMKANPTIEGGVIDIVPLAAEYVDEKLGTFFFVRNGTGQDVKSENLESMIYTVTDSMGETIAQAPFILKKELLGTLKPGEVRAMRFDFIPENVTIKDYDFTKGFNAYIEEEK